MIPILIIVLSLLVGIILLAIMIIKNRVYGLISLISLALIIIVSAIGGHILL